uniref:Si:ch211-63p21.8 n=1 Tax=Tetraodon nigroviridis TaxID=99883 RepID=H3CPQ3_TETNG
DVILDVGGASFHAHKVLLAASSDYFRGMFTSGMRESRQSRVALRFQSASEIAALISCSYDGTLPLSWDCVFEITCTALQLQFQQALALCLRFLKENIEVTSCLDVASFAEAYGASELEEANDFILRNFWEVSETAKFQDLTAEKLLEIIGQDGLCVPTELAVFRAVSSWIEADPRERVRHAGALMTGVRFPLMTFREFREVRAINLRMECLADDEVGAERVRIPEQSSPCPTPQGRPPPGRGDRMSPEGGAALPAGTCGLQTPYTAAREMEWRRLGQMPDRPRFRHGVAAAAGRLYVVGGCFFYTKDDIMKSAYSYDPFQNCWKQLADMSNFCAVAHGGGLYAIGGDKEINTNIDSVEMYNLETDSWSYVHSLPQALSGHGVSVTHAGIFISGGFNSKYECLPSTFLYDPASGATPLADMASERALHCMEALQGRLYVAGGVRNLRKFYTDQLACEVYDPGTDTWTAVATLPVPHVGAASAVLEGKIYILGGYSQDDYAESGLVHRFDPCTQRWQSMGTLPGAIIDVRACLLRLPQHL